MEKILPTELHFKHIIIQKEVKTSKNKKCKITNKNNKNHNNNASLNVLDPYLKEVISKINIINEEFYDYIIFECGNKDASKEFKMEVRSYLDKVMVNYFKKINTLNN